MSNIQISVIVPLYNAEKFIEACARSILGQTFKNLELVLVNDGSKDNSLEICQRIADEDSRVKVLDKENGGTSSAKNLGLDKAEGEYIAFCDADDTMDAEYLANLYKGVLLNNVDVCVGSFAFVRVSGSEIIYRRTINIYEGLFSLKEFMKFYPEYMPNAVIGSPCNKLYKKCLIDINSIRFNTNIKNNEDTHFNYEYLAKCKTVYVSDAPFYNYFDRVDIKSASKGFIPNIFDIYVMTYKKAIDFLKITDTYKENILFQNEYFIGLVIGAINGIVNGKNEHSKKEKIELIKNICCNECVCKAVKTVNFNNPKKKIIAALIKMKMPLIIYQLFSLNKKV